MLYLWVKTAHIFAIVAWMAGLLYLPRLFVYHSATPEPEFRTRFTEYESLLYRRIMRPAMIATLVLGFWLLHLGWAGFGSSSWIWIKLLAVALLLGYHHYCGALIRRFQNGNPHSERFFRIFNEGPAVMLILILIMVVVKPF
ncbi:MAG: protoporphyrinogen oxidase HemJ [Pseudomonadota bacterium]